MHRRRSSSRPDRPPARRRLPFLHLGYMDEALIALEKGRAARSGCDRAGPRRGAGGAVQRQLWTRPCAARRSQPIEQPDNRRYLSRAGLLLFSQQGTRPQCYTITSVWPFRIIALPWISAPNRNPSRIRLPRAATGGAAGAARNRVSTIRASRVGSRRSCTSLRASIRAPSRSRTRAAD